MAKCGDVYHIGDEYLVIVASDRISAFDCILPRPIPYKGAGAQPDFFAFF